MLKWNIVQNKRYTSTNIIICQRGGLFELLFELFHNVLSEIEKITFIEYKHIFKSKTLKETDLHVC